MKSLERKIDLIKKTLLYEEKEELGKFFITEMKKIGIEKLPYSYSSLKKFIDSETMDFHYNKHYKGYVEKLNKIISKDKRPDMELEEIIKSISKFNQKVRNNAGGAFNHALFWKMLSPKTQKPNKELLQKINKDFGSYSNFKKEFEIQAKDKFGSGWVWLIITKNKKLKITTTSNQDNPLMNVVDKGGFPILGLDLWEHAYYLKYQNKRDSYIKNFWYCVNWDFVYELYKQHNDNINESVETKKLLNEALENFPLTPKNFKNLINSTYEPCQGRKFKDGCLGKIETKKCVTELGVIGGKFSERKYGGVGNWSIINRFDTNSKVHKEIIKIYNEEGGKKQNFLNWINQNILDLVGNNGKYTKRLVDINSETIREGALTESYAKEIIKEVFGLNDEDEGMTWEIHERCGGDIRDRNLGQDFDVKLNGKSYFFQIKPVKYQEVEKYGSERGYYYRVPSWYNHSKYKEENVDVIMYVDRNQEKFIMFRNDFTKIQTVANPKTFPKFFIYYYENPIKMNFDLQVKIEKPQVPSKPALERKKEDEINYYRERIDYYKGLIKKLGGDENLQERVNRFESKLYKLLN